VGGDHEDIRGLVVVTFDQIGGIALVGDKAPVSRDRRETAEPVSLLASGADRNTLWSLPFGDINDTDDSFNDTDDSFVEKSTVCSVYPFMTASELQSIGGMWDIVRHSFSSVGSYMMYGLGGLVGSIGEIVGDHLDRLLDRHIGILLAMVAQTCRVGSHLSEIATQHAIAHTQHAIAHTGLIFYLVEVIPLRSFVKIDSPKNSWDAMARARLEPSSAPATPHP
jgi:hypothetical protein